jgi:hypothetical protein
MKNFPHTLGFQSSLKNLTGFSGLKVFIINSFFGNTFLHSRKVTIIQLNLKSMETLSQTYEAAEAYAVFFKNVFNDPCLRESSTSSRSFDSLCLASVSGSGVSRPLSTCDLQNPAFITNGCCGIFILVLKFLFGVGLAQRSFHILWKQLALVPVFIKGNSALVTNYR